MSRTRLLAVALAATGGAAAVAAVLVLRTEDDDGRSRAGHPDDDAPVHIHGLGVNPADGALYIATHTGLWRAPADARKAERVGTSRQDTMGFTVVGPDEFLGSGHPDVEQMREENLPPHLGLIRSRDGGLTWEAVSLSGEADLHVLRAAGSRIYGVDATSGRFLASDDGGRSWDERATPAPVFDLSVDPAARERIVAVTEQGLLESRDGGGTWRRLAHGPLGFLAWDDDGALYAVDGAGTVHVSRDGTTWREAGAIGGEPAALAAHEGALYVALHDGRVVVSRDGGRTFETRVEP